jgi:hypothetical protein
MEDIFIPILSIIASIFTAYFSAKYVFSRQFQQGKIQLLDISVRYFLIFLNLFDKETKKVLTDKISKKQYIYSLTLIEQDLRQLTMNPYYNQLNKKYPEISKLLVLLQREIIFLESNDLAANQDTYQYFSKIYTLLKKELPKKYLSNEGFIGELNTLQKSLDGIFGKK